MSGPSTPPRPTVAPDPCHTAETAANTPRQTDLKAAKKVKTSIYPPSKSTATGRDTATDTEPTLQGIIAKHYTKVDRDTKIRKDVITQLAITIDSCVSLYSGENQTTHKRIAKEYAYTLVEHLKNAIPCGTLPGPSRLASAAPRTDTTEANPRAASRNAKPTYAAAAQWGRLMADPPATNARNTRQNTGPTNTHQPRTNAEDSRVLVRVIQDRLTARLPPFPARMALLDRLNLEEGSLKDVQHTKTG